MDTTKGLLLLLLLGFCNAQLGDDDGDKGGSENSAIDYEDIGTTILRLNNGSNEMLLEGDLFIPRTRSAIKCKNSEYSCLWSKSDNGDVEVPYILSDKYDDSETSLILKAMKGFESSTCIRFIPRSNEIAYISIEPKFGCFSLLGRIGDKQVVSLQRFGCVNYGIIQHELMHVLGFYHEHTRSDRDQYVNIIWANIQQYYTQDFQKMDTNNLDTSYDYSSIMQYGRTAFGINGKDTIVPIPDGSVPIGQTNGLSQVDILRVNKLYNC